jgi:hypothetical protein
LTALCAVRTPTAAGPCSPPERRAGSGPPDDQEQSHAPDIALPTHPRSATTARARHRLTCSRRLASRRRRFGLCAHDRSQARADKPAPRAPSATCLTGVGELQRTPRALSTPPVRGHRPYSETAARDGRGSPWYCPCPPARDLIPPRGQAPSRTAGVSRARPPRRRKRGSGRCFRTRPLAYAPAGPAASGRRSVGRRSAASSRPSVCRRRNRMPTGEGLR